MSAQSLSPGDHLPMRSHTLSCRPSERETNSGAPKIALCSILSQSRRADLRSLSLIPPPSPLSHFPFQSLSHCARWRPRRVVRGDQQASVRRSSVSLSLLLYRTVCRPLAVVVHFTRLVSHHHHNERVPTQCSTATLFAQWPLNTELSSSIMRFAFPYKSTLFHLSQIAVGNCSRSTADYRSHHSRRLLELQTLFCPAAKRSPSHQKKMSQYLPD